MAMLLGQTLKDRYQVNDQLGAGGAATVYLATDTETGQTVTVKMLHPHLIDEEFAGRFEREIDLLQQIDSPYLDTKSNGLTYLADRMKGQDIFAHVHLVKGERSYLADLASNLL